MATGLILVNESSGDDDCGLKGLATLFAGHRTEPFAPDTVAARIQAAIADGSAFVGVAGGDGTIRSVVQEIVGTHAALLPIPCGTRNHFARTMGIEDLDLAVAAAGSSAESVDVGEVNGRYFVNNATIGLYPEFVVKREDREATLPKALANILATWRQLWRGRKTTVTVEGTRVQAWMVFVGNGRYGDHVGSLGTRESLTQNVLDVRVVRADRRAARVRVLGALLVGRLGRSPLLLRLHSAELNLEFRDRTAQVALDGEVEALPTPLHFRSRPLALAVLVPPVGT